MNPPADIPASVAVETAREHPTALQVPAADAAALSLVVLLIFCVACFVWGATILGRRERRTQVGTVPGTMDTGVEANTQGSDPSQSRAAWEREPDWWKQ